MGKVNFIFTVFFSTYFSLYVFKKSILEGKFIYVDLKFYEHEAEFLLCLKWTCKWH